MKAFFILLFKKKKLINELTQLFVKDAEKFNGLYKGIFQLSSEKNERKLRALDEFYTRLSYLTGYNELKKMLSPFFPTNAKYIKRLVKLSGIILEAASKADICCTDVNKIITLTNGNAMDYQDWDGGEIYEGDTVKVVLPAWYQKRKLLEQGYCIIEEQ